MSFTVGSCVDSVFGEPSPPSQPPLWFSSPTSPPFNFGSQMNAAAPSPPHKACPQRSLHAPYIHPKKGKVQLLPSGSFTAQQFPNCL